MSIHRDREERRRRMRETPRVWAGSSSGEQEAVPSKYGIKHIDEISPEDHPEVVLYCRVSDGRQNISGQKRGSRHYLEERGFGVVKCWGEVGSITKVKPEDRPKLMHALAAARKRGIPLATTCISRFLRNADYHAHRQPEVKPTVTEFEAFLEKAKGVLIVTLNDPDASPPEDEAFLGKMAMDEVGRKVGRPRKKEPGYRKARREYLTLARKRREQGWSNPEIAREISQLSGDPITAEGVRKWPV